MSFPLVRKLVLGYSVRNRRRKARDIAEFLRDRGCRTVLFVGAMGSEHDDDPNMANAGIVEKSLMAEFDVKMGINVTPVVSPYPFVIADARELPFDDDYVDFALANAVVEHVGSEPDQEKMVKEMTRVARCCVITTPNRWFPVESHTSVLFLHWWPEWRRRHTSEFTRLLSRSEFKRLLPDNARIVGHPWSPTFTAYLCR